MQEMIPENMSYYKISPDLTILYEKAVWNNKKWAYVVNKTTIFEEDLELQNNHARI